MTPKADTSDAVIASFGQNLPRYTSYPTAPHFADSVTDETVSQWISAVPSHSQLSLYVHIPYCRQMCWYCGCNTKAVSRGSVVDDYLDHLALEFQTKSALLGRDITVTHLHFGGGSPTLLPPHAFDRVMDLIRQHFNLDPALDFAIEMDPREMSEAKIAAYARAGVTRASLGVQDFDIDVQRAINRVQPFRTVFRAVSQLRDYGIEAINLDLIYGLPLQNEDTMKKATEKALLMKPSRISLFGYAHVPWMKSHMRLIDEDSLPDADQRLRLFKLASDILIKAGYVAVGLDHFVKPVDPMAQALTTRRLSRNFQGYTTDTSDYLLGFGPSAISSTPDGYWQNTPDMRPYKTAVKASGLATVRGLALSKDDHIRRAVISGLMCYYDFDLESFRLSLGLSEDYFDTALDRLKPLLEADLVAYEKGVVTIKGEARQLVRIVAACFDAYLNPKKHKTDKKHAQVA